MPHAPVTQLSELLELSRDEILEGYISTKKGDPEPGDNRSRAFHHGWRTAMMDLGEMKIPDEHRRLVREIMNHWKRKGI